MVRKKIVDNEKKRHSFMGKVVSDKMDKTIIVEIERIFRHPIFHKTVRSRRRYKVHDEYKKAKIGDVVVFYEGRPVSKTKYMYLDRVVGSGSIEE